MANYSLVIDSKFQPFTFEEMLTPWTMYKAEYDKLEDNAVTLQKNADVFKYLSETLPEDSKARQIYDNYSNQLNQYVDDVLKRGVSIGARNGIMQMKRRYAGEIGRLEEANTALQKELEQRRQMGAKDSSLLYATDNLNIDAFLDKKTPNLYSISGTELYTRGAAAGKAASSRIVSAGDRGRTLGGYYRDWISRVGYNADSINAFRQNASALPELQEAAEAILAERGVQQNLTGDNLERARQSVINGIIDGAIYQESHNPVRDAGVMSAAESAADIRANEAAKRAEREASKTDWMYNWKNGKAVSYSDEYLKMVADGTITANGKPKTDKSSKKHKKVEISEADKVFESINKKEKGYKYLNNNAGFAVAYEGKKHTYKYVGGIKHDARTDEQASGRIGEGSNRWFGMTSASNIIDWGGDFTAEKMGKGTRVLTERDMAQVLLDETGQPNWLYEKVSKMLEAQGYNPETTEWRLIQVPREHGNPGAEYLLAVEDNR